MSTPKSTEAEALVPPPSGATGDAAEVDIAAVDGIVAELGRVSDALMPVLQAIQQHYRYLPEAALRRVCEITEITPAAIAGVASFYPRFRHRPAGQHVISVCHGTACHVKGAGHVTDALRRHLDLGPDDETTADRLFTVQRVDCLGCCTLAPVVQIDGVTYGHLTPHEVPQMLSDFAQLQHSGARQNGPSGASDDTDGLAEIRVGAGSCCIAGGSMRVLSELESAISVLRAPAVVKPVGCVGMCHQTPMVEVHPPGQPPAIYARVQPADADAIVRRHFSPSSVIGKMRMAARVAVDCLLTDEAWQPVTRYALDVRDPGVSAFLGPQRHVATELYGAADPLDLRYYLQHGGFESLRKCLTEMTPEQVIETVGRAGLRGRGGAGFPTGTKWGMVRRAQGQPKYVICNGDEGDPGAFMDRMLLESYPFRVLEGLAIAAYAVGARQGVLYIRAEYPLAVERVWQAMHICEDEGLLGDNLFRSGFGLYLTIMEGAGAFVAGEETGLIASLEGRRASPRFRPPYPAESGLWGQPTCVNNVETLALVPAIVRDGGDSFAILGTERSKGTKVFALAGKVKRGGLIEVPMGITIRQIVEEIGGGVAGDRQFKAVQIGGPSGGCIPEALADTPVDFEALTQVGAIMGSGGLVVMDDGDCMLDVARYFLEFTQRESCGKCTPCRIGTRRMLDILEALCSGTANAHDLAELEELATMVKRSSLCGLGQTAPNPVLTTLRYFRDEYEAHLEGTCPAGKCTELITYRITDKCIGCTKCAQQCPSHAINLMPYQQHSIDNEKCIRCDTCRQVCAFEAVVVE